MTYPNKGKVVDDNTKYEIDEVFDLDSGIENRSTPKLITYQFIHVYVSFTEFSEGGKVAGVLLCSDWEKKNSLRQLPIGLAIKIIEDVIETKEMHLVRNEITGEI